jgi:superfamily II DNA or RNA helicase
MKTLLPKIYLRHRLFIPQSLFTPEIRKAFSVVIENYYPEFDENGDPIEQRDLLIKGYKTHPNGYVSLARGHLDKVWKVFEHTAQIVDQRVAEPLSFDLKWLGVLLEDGATRGALKPEQERFISDMMARGYGMGEAPPRFGKTICMSNITCRAGLKTLVVVHQVELAEQFESEFRRCTNVDQEERRHRRKLIGFCRSFEDFEKYDICITTWNRFHAPKPREDVDERTQQLQIRRGKAVAAAINRLRNSFGLVLVDEAHRAASACFSSVVGQFNPWYRFGVTATPDRKDQLDAVIKLIVGPVVTRADEQKVLLRVRPVYTGFVPHFTRWHAYEAQIARDARRNKLALSLVEKDVKAGHSVVVVCKRTKHILEFTQALVARGIRAEAFWSGQKDRKGLLVRARKGQTQVVVAYRGMLLGINVPRWSSMHILSPGNNAPNHVQEMARVRTIMDGKRYAVLRDYLDACGASNGCYRTRHRVYTDARRQPVIFEDETGTPIKRLSFEYIRQRALEPRPDRFKGKVQSLAEMGATFGAAGPKRPNFTDEGAQYGAPMQMPKATAWDFL